MSPLKPGQKFAYGICRFGTSIFMNVTTLATYWIYANHFSLDPFLSGTGNAVGKIIIGLSGFIFGYISDILPPKWGRRKFFIWTGAPALALSFVMLFIPHLFIPINSQTSVFVWLLIWNSLFNLFYGYLLTPYQSWMAEITTEDDRVQISGIQNTTNLTSTLFGIGFSFLIAGMLEDAGGITSRTGTILLITIIVFAVIEVVAFLPALLTIKEEAVEREERNIWREFKIVLTNKNYVIWFMAQGIYSVGLSIINALVLDFATDILGLTGFVNTAIFGLTMFGTIMICFILWGYVAKKIGKKKSLIIGFSELVVVLPLTLIVGRIPVVPMLVQGGIFAVLIGIGLSAPYLFPYAIIADIADKDERITSENRAGMYTGFNSIPLNIFQALALLLVGFLGGLENNLGLLLLGPIAAGFILLSIPVIWFGNFDPFMEENGLAERTEQILEEVEDKNDVEIVETND
ncbi:MAG: MFS transporter [Candidatus Heimdallarchaeota archaeon]|nr:MFS transporter [Candidatus Heimdallarchaeota archaeon]